MSDVGREREASPNGILARPIERMYAFTRYQDHRRFLEMERAYVRRKAATGP